MNFLDEQENLMARGLDTKFIRKTTNVKFDEILYFKFHFKYDIYSVEQ
jgi:hypothetical protein